MDHAMEKKIVYLTRAPIIINQFLILLVDYSNQINIAACLPCILLFESAWPKISLGVGVLPTLQLPDNIWLVCSGEKYNSIHKTEYTHNILSAGSHKRGEKYNIMKINNLWVFSS